MRQTPTQPSSLWREVFDGFRPPRRLTVIDYARENLPLPDFASQNGYYDPAKTPYMIAIGEALSESDPTQEVIFVKGSQIGGSQIGLAWAGYVGDVVPGPMIIVWPTTDMGEEWSKDYLAQMIDSIPSLRAKVSDEKSRVSGNTIALKKFPGGYYALASANNAKSLRRRPGRYLYVEEEDEFTDNIQGQGDPYNLARARVSTYGDRFKIYRVSTPTDLRTSRILRAYAETDRRFYFVPCPRCGHMQVLRFRDAADGLPFVPPWDTTTGEYRVKWEADHPERAWYECESCHGRIENYEKTSMLAAGEWRPTAQGKPRKKGFHLSSLYSPAGWKSWGTIASSFVDATAAAKVGDLGPLITWVNHEAAEGWEDRGLEAVSPDEIEARVDEGATRNTLPPEVMVLTAGIDTQSSDGGWLSASVWGWGVGEEGYLIDRVRILGDPDDIATQDQVWLKVMDRLWDSPHGQMRVEAACWDSGGHNTDAVYQACNTTEARRRRLLAIKGSKMVDAAIWDGQFKKGKGKTALRFYYVGVNQAKSTIYRRLSITDPGPGCMHFPAWLSNAYPDYFKELTSNTKQRNKDKAGHIVYRWIRHDSKRDEALDEAVYALAALKALLRNRRVRLDTPKTAPSALPDPVPPNPKLAQPTKTPVVSSIDAPITQADWGEY